jgi:uncharacterized protein (TIGR03382 family)
MSHVVSVFLVLSLAGAARAQGFVDASQDSGVDALRAQRPESWWLSGMHFVDLDGDGDLDFFMSSHGSFDSIAALNDGTGHFTLAQGSYPTSEIHVPYDIDEDGKLDLSMTYGDGGGLWWRNASSPGALSFISTDVSRTLSRQQAMIDINRDGKVDWLHCSNDGVQLNFGDGHGAFEDNSMTLTTPGGDSIAPVPVDIDGDRDEDLIVEWGRYGDEDGETRLYLNDGDMHFTDATTAAGLTQAGLAVLGTADVDQDGDMDLIGLEHRALPASIFLNDGHGHFTRKAGAIAGVPDHAATYASWGMATGTDFDNDGTLDLIITGRNYLHLLRGTGGGNFTYMNDAWGIPDVADANLDNGYAFGDIDGDGDLDVASYSEFYPDKYAKLYRNELAPQNWLRIRPVGLPGNRGAAGAKVFVYAAGTQQLLQYEEISIYAKQAQQNYYGLATTERHYGLGMRASVDVAVQFYPSSKRVELDGVAANSTVEIDESGEGTVVPPPGDGSGTGTPGGSDGSGADPDARPAGGCNAGGWSGASFAAVVVVLASRRRRRRTVTVAR